jgi:hypothetical protein
VNSIFTSFYYLRSKDFNEEIRYRCLCYLEAFLLNGDPVKPLKNEYLKFLGYACYDHYAANRLEAIEIIKSLIQVID